MSAEPASAGSAPRTTHPQRARRPRARSSVILIESGRPVSAREQRRRPRRERGLEVLDQKQRAYSDCDRIRLRVPVPIESRRARRGGTATAAARQARQWDAQTRLTAEVCEAADGGTTTEASVGQRIGGPPRCGRRRRSRGSQLSAKPRRNEARRCLFESALRLHVHCRNEAAGAAARPLDRRGNVAQRAARAAGFVEKCGAGEIS